MIEIHVNSEMVSVPIGSTLEQVLKLVDVPPNYLAVEVNAEVVPREEHATRVIQAGDQLEVVTLVGGG
ncbi:MAG: sulfur carrier protein ThiS [Rubripirellula sp.]|nr:sulfur carrier protein ThiS [Rubripirellula sp.]